jgi:tRNA(fMet)-specific endonuclease VapC
VRYLLDTNICIYIGKHPAGPPAVRLAALPAGDVGMSIVSYLELVYGAWNSERREANLANAERIRRAIPVLPLNVAAAGHFGRIRVDLERKGRPIGPYDLMIAAHALSLDLILVTNNTREFARIEGLRLENWAA